MWGKVMDAKPMSDSEIAKFDAESVIANKLADTFQGKATSSVNDTEQEIEAQIAAEQAHAKMSPEKSTAASEEEEEGKEFVQKSKQEAGKDQSPSNKSAGLPTLPDAYKRSAIHQEWTEDEIDEFYNADPEKALKTFARLHESNNKLSQKYSEFGNLQAQQEQMEQKRIVDEQAHESTFVQPKQPSPINMDELKQAYGDDPIVDIVQKLSDQITNAGIVRPVEKTTERYQQPVEHYQPPIMGRPIYDQNAALKTLDTFFASEATKEYDKFYGEGNDWNKLSPGEFANRREVVQLAGSIVAGASIKNEQMSDELALEKAHMIVSQPYLEKAIVADIHKQLHQRSGGITIRKGANTVQQDAQEKTGSQLTATEREQRAKVRLDKLFNRS
jgi:hypothetical protein